MVHLVRELARGYGQGGGAARYELSVLVLRASGGRTDQVEQLLPREAWMLIEALKAMNGRDAAREKHRQEEGFTAAGAWQRAAAGKDARVLGGTDGGTDAATLF
jgi:hypothetical protein